MYILALHRPEVYCYNSLMLTIEQNYSINAPAEKVWDALTSTELMEKWGAGPVKFDARVGGKFSLWGGDIDGTNTKVEPNKLLEQDWYSHSTSDRRYKVSFSLHEKAGVTEVKVVHEGVTDSEFQDFADGWRDYYFDPIKQLLET